MNLLCKIFLFLLLFANTTAFAQLPPNIGFENGNFNQWDCSVGTRHRTLGDLNMGTSGAPSARHTMIDATQKDQLDYYGKFPVLCPNGSGHSIKLGDDQSQSQPANSTIGGRVQSISRTFNVMANSSLIFNYAVVLEDARNATFSHGAEIQPKFTIRVIDVASNAVLSCPYFDFTASSTLPGFLTSDERRSPDAEVIYKDWSTALINLNAFVGKEVRIEFTSTDCAPGAHFGYAYLDVDEVLSLNPISGNIFCSNQTAITLTGPSGFKEYTWYNDSDLSTAIGDKQRLPVNAVANEKYTLRIVPYDNSTCIEYLHVTLKDSGIPFQLVVQPSVGGCFGVGVNLKDPSVTLGSSTDMTYSYFKDITGSVYLPNPDKVLEPGKYYIRGTNGGGCTDIREVNVVIYPSPVITVIPPLPVTYPAKVDLSTTHEPTPGLTFRYFKDAAATIESDNYVGDAGTYYIKAVNSTSCTSVSSVKIMVNPPPPYTIEAPNTFTPNGDGMNDLFKIKIDGFVSLTQLAIFNRYGQQVFTTRSINDYWTGNSGSSQLPAGTYYWIFDGIDDYYHTKVKKSSSITIIR